MTDKKLLETAKKRFKACMDHYASEYERGGADLLFLLGETQWDEKIRKSREEESRPCLTENRLMTFAHQVINDIRKSRPSIGVNPVDDNADIVTARIMKGLVRNIEYVSDADTVYDTASWNSISTGYGWIRVNTKYAGEDTFDKEIELVRVPNFRSVMLDPNTKKMDGSDAEFGFVYEDIDRDDFEDQYPDADPVSFEEAKGVDWCTKDRVRVAEYFYKTYKAATLVLTHQGPMLKDEAEARGLEIFDERDVRLPTVKWCKLTGNEILDQTDWEGTYIPLVPVYGEEVFIDGVRRSYSLITQAKDPQTRYNYWLSASTEIIALQPKTPFIGMAGQFETARAKWNAANRQNFAFLEFDAVELKNGNGVYANPPQRQMPPTGSPQMFSEMMAAADGIKATLGIYDASLGAKGNETSGKAIMARQAEGDNATFHFVDNLQKAIAHVGRICVDLIPKIMSGPRIARIIGDDDAPQTVPINQNAIVRGNQYFPITSKEPGDRRMINLNHGKYDVVCSVGANYQTKRQEMVAFFQELYRALPEAARLTGDLFAKNLDVPEADTLAERMKALLPPELKEDDPGAAQLQMAAQQIQALQTQLQAMDSALKEKKGKEEAEIQAELAKTQADIEKTKAETAKILAELQAVQAQAAGMTPEIIQEIIRTVAELEQSSRDTAQAVDAILTHEESKQATLPPATIGNVIESNENE